MPPATGRLDIVEEGEMGEVDGARGAMQTGLGRGRRRVALRWLAVAAGLGVAARAGGERAEAGHGPSDAVGALHVNQWNGGAPGAFTRLTGNPAANALFSVGNNVTSGFAAAADGIQGYASGANNAGVRGGNNAANGLGVDGSTTNGIGVQGSPSFGTGVNGVSAGNGTAAVFGTGYQGAYGVRGTAAGNYIAGLHGEGTGPLSYGVVGVSQQFRGVVGVNVNGQNHAGYFLGQASGTNPLAPGLYVGGTFEATGTKSAVVQTSKGATLLYALEAPEALFEDVGRRS